MAWTVSRNKLDAYGTEMTDNAILIYNQMTAYGWSTNAICALLGNMQAESSINPGVVQGWVTTNPPTAGYGLIQWTNVDATTPYENPLWVWTYDKYEDWNWDNGDRQLVFINTDDASGWIIKSGYNLTYNEFKVSTQSVAYLTRVYFENRERGTWTSSRITYAQHWYEYFTGQSQLYIAVNITGNGVATVYPTVANQGDTITLTVTPNSGESLVNIDARTTSGYSVALYVQTGSQTFTMPSESVIISVEFTGTTPTPTPRTIHRMPIMFYFKKRRII